MITRCNKLNILDISVMRCSSLFILDMGYISLCHVDNHIRRFKRPEWIAHRNFTAIACLPDDCLLELSSHAAEQEA